MGKHKHFKFMGFLNISGEAGIHSIPKTWKKWISIVQQKHGKTQTFQIYGFFFNILGETGIHSIPKTWKSI